MRPTTELPAGVPVFTQPVGEHRRQQALGYGLALFALGAAGLMAALLASGISSTPLVAAPVAGLAAIGILSFVAALRQGEYALHENGIRLPAGRFVPYGEVRDVQQIDHRNRRTKFLILALNDGTFGVVGTPMTKNVWFATSQFDRVESLVEQGVRRYARPPGIEWDPVLWDRVSSLLFRGPLIINAERFAREHGLGRIDQRVLEDAAVRDRRIRYWFAATARATARTQTHPKRKPTP